MGWTARVVYTADGEQVRAVWRVLIPVIVGVPLYFGAYMVGPALIRGVTGTDVAGTAAVLGALAVFLAMAAGIGVATGVVMWLKSWLDRRGSVGTPFAVLSAWIRDFVGGVGIGAVASVVTVVYLALRGLSDAGDRYVRCRR